LWSYPNPQGKNPGKELCDILVVCEPDVIIFSVKEIGVTDNRDIMVNWNRWQREAVQRPARDIYGAERWITKNKSVITKDGKPGLPFPRLSFRRLHRVVVALGGGREVPIPSADFGKGFVHVYDEKSLDTVMIELDTITDFIRYLRDMEALHERNVKITLVGGEEDLLALYLKNGREFPPNVNAFLVEEGLWADFSLRPEYRRKKEADKNSYLWDRLIELICQDFRSGKLDTEGCLEDVEQVLRVMAREDRFSRWVLSKCFLDFMDATRRKKLRSRHAQSPSGIPYVFLARPHGYDRNQRRAELANRCFVVRGSCTGQTTVIGIATEESLPDKGSSFDIVLFKKETWTAVDQRAMESMQAEMGYFAEPVRTPRREDEYPAGDKE
jgi:hypothetical protein